VNRDELDDEKLLQLVATTDKEFFDNGVEIVQRSSLVPIEVMKKLGLVPNVLYGQGTSKILERIRSTFETIYRKQDLLGGGHIGVFMYRDVFVRIAVPGAYGRVAIKPFECADFTPVQLRMIQKEPDQFQLFIDQFCDVWDIQWGLRELRNPFCKVELVVRYLELSRFNLHAASAILSGNYDFRGAVQPALLAIELALKAGAAAHVPPELSIKDKFGHDTIKLAEFIQTKWPQFDCDRVKRALKLQPSYVLNRYSATQPSRREVGHVLMRAQFVVSEVVRQMSDRDFRKALDQSFTRCYPA
jgi:HEPN domain